MAETHETIADLVAEIRALSNPISDGIIAINGKSIADRLDAAHKRELAVYVLAIAKLRGALVKCRDIALLWQVDEAAGVAGTTDKPHARSAAEAVIDIEFEINAALFATATAEKLSAVGDAAKLREALEHMVRAETCGSMERDDLCGRCLEKMFARCKHDGTCWVDKAITAPAAPPRNCDRFATAEEAAKAWHKHEANDTGEKYCAGCPFNLGEDCARGSVCTIGWLYAEAQEGGANV